MGKPPSLHRTGLIPVKPPTPNAAKENARLGGRHAGSKAMTKSAVELEARIAEAFTEAATSDDVGRLLPEVEGAASSADAVAREARTRALDPLPEMK